LPSLTSDVEKVDTWEKQLGSLDTLITKAKKCVDDAKIKELTLALEKKTTELDDLEKEANGTLDTWVKDWNLKKHDT
jgi:hypothetical protein